MKSDFQFLPDQASTVAGQTDALYGFLCLMTAFFVVLILILVAYFAIRYRRRSSTPPPEMRESKYLESGGMIVMFLITMVIFFWGVKVYFFVYRPPAEALEVHAIGKQWMWKIQHPSGRREINELHVPLNMPVKLTIASQDVIHSFFVPAFRIKMDAVPGRYTVTWFEANRLGEYHLFCAEYCGTDHSRMIGRVIVMEPEKYEQWAAGVAPDETPSGSGGKLFQSLGCSTCHGSQAPTLAGVFGSDVKLTSGQTVKADENYLRESILDSTSKIVEGYVPIMPSYRGQVTEEQLADLIAYIKSIQEPAQTKEIPRPAVRQLDAGSPTGIPEWTR